MTRTLRALMLALFAAAFLAPLHAEGDEKKEDKKKSEKKDEKKKDDEKKKEEKEKKADKAPAFKLKDIHGKERSLEEFAGKLVVLEWINHGCPYVVKHYETGNMQKLQKKYTEKGVIWLSICSSAPGKQGHMSNDKWKKKNEKIKTKATAVLVDADGKVGKLYKARRTPTLFVIDKKGNIAYEGAIDDQRSWKKESIKDAKNYVAQVLDALLEGKPSPVRRTNAYG